MKLRLIASAFAIAFVASSANAQQTNSVNVNAAAFSDTSFDSNSVGLAGLAGGDCSEGFTIGGAGIGIGSSQLNKYCQLAKQVFPAYQMGLLTRTEARALILTSFKGLGFNLQMRPGKPDVEVTSTKSPTTSETTKVRLNGQLYELSPSQLADLLNCTVGLKLSNGQRV